MANIKHSKNKAYELRLTTRIASQRNQYVLLQIGVDTQQEDIAVKDRFYFFVADRKLQKSNRTRCDTEKSAK